ncbi:MAG: helix-turn-helix domain-containing protein [Planctomycetota bacterium]
MASQKPAQPNQSLIRGLDVLQALVSAGRPVGSRELGRQLTLEHTRVNRFLGTLAFLGLAEKTPDRRYTVGPAIHVISAQSMKGSGLLASALPVLRELPAGNLNIALGVLWRDQVCYLFHGRIGRDFDRGIGRHDVYPADKSSIGWVLLAHRREMPPGMGKSPGPERLKRVRAAGYALLETGRSNFSVSVPVGTPPVAGIAVAGVMTAGEARAWVGPLRQAAGRIEDGMVQIRKS